MTRALKERCIMSMETKRPGPEGQRTPEENYEHSDADVRGIGKSAIWLAVLLIVVFVAMRWTFNKMSEMEPMGAAASPFVDSRQMPPAPRLQVDPQKEISDYCATQAASLNSYGWKDSKAGIVQIPVDRAFGLMGGHPLPARAGGGGCAVGRESAALDDPARGRCAGAVRVCNLTRRSQGCGRGRRKRRK